MLDRVYELAEVYGELSGDEDIIRSLEQVGGEFKPTGDFDSDAKKLQAIVDKDNSAKEE